MVTLTPVASTSHAAPHAHAPSATIKKPAKASLLRMGLPTRLGLACGAVVFLWSAMALGLS